MRTVEQHRSAALALADPLTPVTSPLEQADDHVLAEDVFAPWSLPRWDSSAMDGYAVRAADVARASADTPVTLAVVAELPAGTDAAPEVGPGTAARIMTGAPVPPGCDAVVPVEATDGGTVTVAVRAASVLGAHVRPAGEDVTAGQVVMTAGTYLGPAQVAAAASVGRASLAVHRRPRVAVLSTGSELVTPGATLEHGQVADSNSYLLAAAVRGAGCEPVRLGAVTDDAATLRAVLDAQEGHVDAVVSSGGVSMGAYDVVKEVLAGAPGMAFVSVAMQPGKPQGLGRLPGGTPMFALPGNPVSAYISFEVFVRPALLRMRGLTAHERPLVSAVVTDGWSSPAGRAQYMPVVFDGPVGDGVAVRRAGGGGSRSHLVAGLAKVEGLAVVAADVETVHAGDVLAVWEVGS